MRHRRCLALMVVVLLGSLAAPAAADPAGPTHFRSTVTDVSPAVEGFDVAVLGGDAYVQVTADPGVTVEVDGYDDEPYVRIEADGTVQRNAASPSRWLNEARFGALDTAVPPEASAEAPPRWEVVANGGTYAWHDHRVHWMSPTMPRQVDAAADEVQRVQTWELALVVDDEPVVVSGELDWLPGPTLVPPIVVTLLVAGLGAVAILRRPGTATTVAVAGALTATAVGVAATLGWPAGADTEPALLILPGVSLLLVGLARAVRRRPGTGPQLLAAAAGFPLLVWSVLWIRALTVPIIPTALPDPVARLLIAVVLGAGLTTLVAVGRSVLAPTPAPATTSPDPR